MTWKTPLWVLAGIYLFYLAVSLLLVLPALNFLTPWAVEKYTGRNLQTDIILFNPFNLTLEVKNASLPEQNGDPFVAFDHARVDLSITSLWQPGIVFDEVSLDSLYLHVRRLASGDFNFSDMLPPDSAAATTPPEPPPSDAARGPIQLTIDELALHAERIEVSDEQREKIFNTHWDDLTLRALGLSTVVEDGKPYNFRLTDESGGELAWEGQLSIPDASSQGSLELTNLDLQPLWRFAEPWLEFQLHSGRLHARGSYEVDWGDALHYALSDGLTEVTGLSIKPKDVASLPDTLVNLGKLAINGVEVDGTEQAAVIQTVAFTGLDIAGWSEGDRVSLSELFAINLPTEEVPEEEPEPTPWRLQLGALELGESKAQWRSEYTDPPVLKISPLEARVANLQFPPEGDTDISLNLAVNDTAKLELSGGIALDTGAGNVNYKLSELPMAWFSPNIPEAFKAEITAGWISTAGDVELAEFQPTRLVTNGSSRDAAGVIRGEEDALTSWDKVEWKTLAVDLENRTLNLQKLAVNGYSGRLHIYEDGSINLQRVLEAEVDQAVEAGTLDEEAMGTWVYAIRMITIDNSKLDFMDESMPLVFRTQIGDLRGFVSDLGSRSDANAEIEVRGSVDGYAPVQLKGTANALAEQTDVDLSLSFEGLDLVRLTPYSGTYAGYAIDRGTLNVDVRYQLEGSRLKGDNSLVIDQLKLGEKIDSAKAMDVPLKLGLALLTDINGIIDLKIPVSGDVDNPEFSLASVIAGAVINLITKAAMAPFNLLAGLVGSEDDLQRINFPAGSAEPDELARNKLLDVAKALEQRPALKLIIYGRLRPDADREKLQRDQLRATLIAQGLSPAAIDARDESWINAITSRYSTLAAGAADNAETPVTAQYDKVVASMPVSDEVLLKLAADRAVTVKQILVNEGGLAADRAVIEQATIAPADNSFSGAELDVGA